MRAKMMRIVVVLPICLGIGGVTIGATQCDQKQAIEIGFQVATIGIQTGWPYLDTAARNQCKTGKWTEEQCKYYDENAECIKTAATQALPLLAEWWIQSIEKGDEESPGELPTAQLFMDIYAKLPVKEQMKIRTAILALPYTGGE